jgi:hypothetical protein
MSRRSAATLKTLADDPEVSPYAFLRHGGMRGVEARALIELRREWLATVEAWAVEEDHAWTKRRLADEVKRLRRQLGIVRTIEERRAATRDRVRRHRERHRGATV